MDTTRGKKPAFAPLALLVLLCGCPGADPLGIDRPSPALLAGRWTFLNASNSSILGCADFQDNAVAAYFRACDADKPADIYEAIPVTVKGREVNIQWSVRDENSVMVLHFQGIIAEDAMSIDGELALGFEDSEAALLFPARLIAD